MKVNFLTLKLVLKVGLIYALKIGHACGEGPPLAPNSTNLVSEWDGISNVEFGQSVKYVCPPGFLQEDLTRPTYLEATCNQDGSYTQPAISDWFNCIIGKS